MLDTQRKIKIIMILLPILLVGLFVWLYMRNEAKKAAEAEYNREQMEKREQAGRDYAKSLEPTAEQIELKKRTDSLAAEMSRIAGNTSLEMEKTMLENTDTTTAEGKQKWAEYKKRINPSE
jgi:Tfp pilus assembly protein PilO